MHIDCPHCEAPLEVDSAAGSLRCGECFNEFQVAPSQVLACPGCGSTLTVPERASAVMCGHCRRRIQLSPPPATDSAPSTPSVSFQADQPGEEAEAHEETSVLTGLGGHDADRLEVMREEFSDGYEVLESLAHGGMGAIYKARQKQPPRTVVLKVMLGGRFASPKYRARFEREAQAVARLEHPGIVSVYEFGELNGQPYFTMEYVEGCDVKQYVLRNSLDKREICRLFLKITRAVAYAHQRGVIHRDIKPSNILVDGEGNPRLLDFGLAQLAGDYSDAKPEVSESGEIMGTPSYMSPEQTLGRPEEMDLRSDVFSLGVLFYELVTDTLPYRVDRARPIESLRTIRELVPRRPSDTNPRVDGDLDSIIMKCLEKERDQRYQSAVELSHDIDRYLQGRPVEARPPTALYHARKLVWRHRGFFLPVAGLLAVLAACAGGFVWQLSRAERRVQDRVRQAETATQQARETSSGLVGFIVELQGVRRKVESLLADGRWEDAHRVAAFAEGQLPPEAGLGGLTGYVRESIAAGTAEETLAISRLAADLRFGDARERMDRLALLAQNLDLAALQGQMRKMRLEFDEICWQALNDRLRQERSARALSAFVAQCPANPYVPEARALLTQMLAGIRFSEWPFDADEALRSQSITAEVLGVPISYQMVLPGARSVEFVLVPAGEFIMGCAGAADGQGEDASPEHPVQVANPFYLARTEITQHQFEAVTGRRLPSPGGASAPGDPGLMPAAVSWEDARLFCERLSQRNTDRQTVRLPTEAQWEYACRAGSDRAYWFGDGTAAGALSGAAWHRDNSRGGPQPVAGKAPNAWGLYDTHGNMMEWCRDWYSPTYYLTSPVRDPQGPATGTYKALRGGSWGDTPSELHSAHRKSARPQGVQSTYGFRVCVELMTEHAKAPHAKAAFGPGGL